MADNRNESEGMAYGRPESRLSASLTEVTFLPPLDVPVDKLAMRYAKLSRIIAEHVLPRLLSLHEQAAAAGSPALPSTSDIGELSRLVLGPANEDAANFVLKLKDGGISLDVLHTELLEPTARHLGELWNEDRIDFVDVTLGVGRLQQLVRSFEGLDDYPGYDESRKVLLAIAPGEQHSMGNSIVQRFLRAAGWHVCACATLRMEDAADIAAGEWFGVMGFSLSSDLHLEELAQAIQRVRKLSMNPKIGIMVGGSAIARRPDWVERVGADGTAANGPAAVILAKKLLAESLA